jgi:hypothetical protein
MGSIDLMIQNPWRGTTMSVDLNTPEATERPAARRRVRRALTAVAISGALLVPTAAVTIAAPFNGNPALSASMGAQGNGNGQGKGRGNGNGQEQSFTECLDAVNPSGNGKLTPAVVMKGIGCAGKAGDLTAGPLTLDEASVLAEQGLDAAETAGFEPAQLPGLADQLAGIGVLNGAIGDTNAGLLSRAADSKLLQAYAHGEMTRGEFKERIAQALVARTAGSAE